jgi:hypothetical protein
MEYRNRKQILTLNVQVVAGADMKILNIVSRHPGSKHDANIYSGSSLRATLDSVRAGELPQYNHLRGHYLLGDQGYMCKTYLLTPLTHAVTEAEKRYNKSHKFVRQHVERTFGALKSKFQCLKILRCKTSVDCDIIVACAVLWNFLIDQKEIEDFDGEEGEFIEIVEQQGNEQETSTRTELLHTIFA